MKKIIILGLLLLLLIPAASATPFMLEPGDPHWIKKEDPSHVLHDMGEYWQSASLKGQTRPSIYFKLPEVKTASGVLTFYYGKDIPRSRGWDKLQLFASKDGHSYQKLWECPAWGYVPKKQVLVRIPVGYQYLYFRFDDGNLNWEILKLWKSMDILSASPTPTPTPPPSTPTPPPSTPTPPGPPIPGFKVVVAIAGLLTVAYLLRKR